MRRWTSRRHHHHFILGLQTSRSVIVATTVAIISRVPRVITLIATIIIMSARSTTLVGTNVEHFEQLSRNATFCSKLPANRDSD
jgi:hypothetical protein